MKYLKEKAEIIYLALSMLNFILVDVISPQPTMLYESGQWISLATLHEMSAFCAVERLLILSNLSEKYQLCFITQIIWLMWASWCLSSSLSMILTDETSQDILPGQKKIIHAQWNYFSNMPMKCKNGRPIYDTLELNYVDLFCILLWLQYMFHIKCSFQIFNGSACLPLCPAYSSQVYASVLTLKEKSDYGSGSSKISEA